MKQYLQILLKACVVMVKLFAKSNHLIVYNEVGITSKPDLPYFQWFPFAGIIYYYKFPKHLK